MNLWGDMPFPGKIGRIFRGLQNLGDGAYITSEIAPVSGESGVVHHMSNTGLMRISSSKKTCPGGTAPAGVVELGEAQTVLRKPVKVGGFDLTSIASNIRPTHIIRHHDDDIRSALPNDKTRHEKKKARGN